MLQDMNAAHSPGTAWYDPGVHVPLGGLVTGVVVVVVVVIESLLKGTPLDLLPQTTMFSQSHRPLSLSQRKPFEHECSTNFLLTHL